MIDKTTIRPQGLYLDKSLHEASCLRYLLPQFPYEQPKSWSADTRRVIRLGPQINGGRAISLYCTQEDDQLRVSEIYVNFARLLYGHNGIPLASQEVFEQAASVFLSLMSCICTKDSYHRALPGIGLDNHSYWNQLEIFAQGSDPNGDFSLCLQSGIHPRARKEYAYGDIEKGQKSFRRSLAWISASTFKLKFYDKQREVDGYNSREKSVSRLEITCPEDELRRHLPAADDQRLRTFTFHDLRRVLFTNLSEMTGLPKGLFAADRKSHAAGLASLAIHTRLNAEEVVDRYYSRAKGSPRTSKSVKREVAQLIGEIIGIDWKGLIGSWLDEPASVEFSDARVKAEKALRTLPDVRKNDLRCIRRAYSQTQMLRDEEIVLEAEPRVRTMIDVLRPDSQQISTDLHQELQRYNRRQYSSLHSAHSRQSSPLPDSSALNC